MIGPEPEFISRSYAYRRNIGYAFAYSRIRKRFVFNKYFFLPVKAENKTLPVYSLHKHPRHIIFIEPYFSRSHFFIVGSAGMIKIDFIFFLVITRKDSMSVSQPKNALFILHKTGRIKNLFLIYLCLKNSSRK